MSLHLLLILICNLRSVKSIYYSSKKLCWKSAQFAQVYLFMFLICIITSWKTLWLFSNPQKVLAWNFATSDMTWRYDTLKIQSVNSRDKLNKWECILDWGIPERASQFREWTKTVDYSLHICCNSNSPFILWFFTLKVIFHSYVLASSKFCSQRTICNHGFSWGLQDVV